jgi:hypothetical protein
MKLTEKLKSLTVILTSVILQDGWEEILLIIIIIINSFYPFMGHRTSTKRRHLVLSLAILFISLQLFPFSNASLWTDLHRVHHLHFQDFVGKSPNVNPKNAFLETYCTPVLCSSQLVH